jgi:orotate phosphoribosyltransferase
VLQHPKHAEALAARSRRSSTPPRVTAVLCRRSGGLIIGHEVARALNVKVLFAERQDGAPHAQARLR